MKPLPLPRARVRALHLVVLWAFAIVEPSLRQLAKTPEYFAVRGFRAADVVLYALALTLGVPAMLVAVEVVAGRIHRTAASVIHQGFVGCLVLLALANVVGRFDFQARLVLLIALVVAFVTAYRFWAPARMFLTMAVLAPVLFVGVFLTRAHLGALSPASEVATRAVDARTPVVVVVFDELAVSSLLRDDDTIDAVRYPHFASLAGSATWYRNATTVYDVTDLAVPAILTGRLGGRDELPTVADHPRSLFTLLGRSYDMRAFQAEARLCPSSLCPDAFPSLGVRLSRVLSDVKTASVRRKPLWEGDWSTPAKEVAHFLAGLGRSRRPQLDVIHVLLPHVPYRYLPSGRAYVNARALPGYGAGFRWAKDSWFVNHNYERYLLQLAYTDHVLGQIAGRLRATGLWDRALVIVTADHGVSFRPGGHRRYVDVDNVGDIAPVPLFVKLPGQQRGKIDRLEATSIDIVPTIADLLGIRVPWQLDGRSLLTPTRRPSSRVVVRSYTGDVVRVSWDEVEKGERQTLAWRTRLFGSGADSIYAEGRDRLLLGRRVESFPRWRSAAIRAEISRPPSVTFDPRSSTAPSRVSGTFDGVSGDDVAKVAVAVNGRIVAVAELLSVDGQSSFSTFVPDFAFRAGRNAISVFAVRTDHGGSLALAPIGAKGDRPSLRAASGH